MLWVSVRRLGAGLIGLATFLAFGRQVMIGQQPVPAAPAANVYVNPFASAGSPASAAGGSPSAARLGYSSAAPGGGQVPGHGSLAASYANPNLGYGSLNNSANNNSGSGAYGNSGYGFYGTQWMMNPYQGYLSGVADITRANAEFYKGIQQAKLTRQEAIRSSIQTRRAMIEEAEWERAHMPDPEKIRQALLERELRIARSTPPNNEIWSARALNTLLRHLITQQGQGAKGPRVPLQQEILDQINVSYGDSRSNVGLLNNGANLRWPLPLRRETFNDARKNIDSLLQTAYSNAKNGTRPDNATLRDLRANYDKLVGELDASVNQLSPDENTEARRYLTYVDGTIKALRNANVVHFFDGKWKLRAQDVGQLVKYMSEEGLWFAEARPRGEAAYVSLYHSLLSYDRGMQRAGRDSSSDSEK